MAFDRNYEIALYRLADLRRRAANDRLARRLRRPEPGPGATSPRRPASGGPDRSGS